MNGLYVIMMMGRPASGKTTVAAHLASALNAEHILLAQYKRLAVNDQYTPRDSLREDLRDISCDMGIRRALELLSQGRPAILDASFHKLPRRQRVYRALCGVCPLLIQVYCLTSNVEETRRRIARRKGMEKDARHHASDFTIFELLDKNFDEPVEAVNHYFSGDFFAFQVDTFSYRIVNRPPSVDIETFSVLQDIDRALTSFFDFTAETQSSRRNS